MKILEVKSNNVKKIMEDFKTGHVNFLDFEEDWEFLTSMEKMSLLSTLSFYVKHSENICLEEV